MQLSTRARYAVMAMSELAARTDPAGGAAVPLAELAAAQGLSAPYLEQLFAALRRAELVAATRGPGGGYRLARSAAAIPIAAIVAAVEEPVRVTRCGAETLGCVAGQRCRTHDLWAELGAQIGLFLGGITLAQVLSGAVRGRAAPPRDAP